MIEQEPVGRMSDEQVNDAFHELLVFLFSFLFGKLDSQFVSWEISILKFDCKEGGICLNIPNQEKSQKKCELELQEITVGQAVKRDSK